MAKVLFVLFGVLIVLNGMTFLLVVNQEGSSDKGTAAAQGASAQGTLARPSGIPDSQVQKLETMIKGVSASITDLSRKVDDLQQKVVKLTALREKAALASPAAASINSAAAALPATGSSLRNGKAAPPAVRKGPVDYSRLPPERTAPGATKDGTEEPEPEEDRIADGGQQQPSATPAHQPSENGAASAGNGAGTTDGAPVEGQPAPADGAANGAGQAKDGENP